MVKSINVIMKKILVSIMIMILLVFFMLEPIAKAAQLPEEGEFYYAGTTKGTYVVTENIFEWLLNHLGDIIEWILGFMIMGFKMSFIGWATIFEWLLTSSLEASIGADYLSDAISATNITSTNDSSQNVTVESIVYNMVPLFDVNFFDFTVDLNRTGTGRDLTQLECVTCKKSYDKCVCTEEICRKKCTCCTTKAAMTEMAANASSQNVVIIIKETVAEWFYIMRFIAVAAMLLVLILIGIKIGLSTLASEKAVYKRMLVDWVVGFIFLFAIEYVMLFIIYLNQLFVDQIRDYAKNKNSIATVTTKQEFGMDEKTNEDLEIGIYEAVRTRAYDPKFTNGLTGTIMYITLVVYAWRFSWMYLKRYFTLIVLTLMAPAVAFSYALQKVFSGKAKAWSKWLNEYIVNVFIQTVHAIIYASCVSIALVISIDSIAGMIVALMLMNFMLKADKMFRKIFKMSSDGGLLDRVAQGAEEAKLDRISKAAQGAISSAKPIANLAAKSPGGQLARAAVQGTAAAAVGAGAKLKHQIDIGRQAKENERMERIQQDLKGADTLSQKAEDRRAEAARIREEAAKTKNNSKKAKMEKDAHQRETAAEKYERQAQEARERALAKMSLKDKAMAMLPEERTARLQELANQEKEALAMAMMAKDTNASQEDREQYAADYKKARAERMAFEKTVKKIEGGGLFSTAANNLFDYDRYFDENGKRKVAYEFNPSTGKMEKKGLRSNVASAFNAKELFGMTDEDAQMAKDVLKASSAGLVGFASMFAGLATIVSSPSAGMAMLAYGTSKMSSATRRNQNIRRPGHRSNYANKHYYNMQFSSGAVRTMRETIVQEVQLEMANIEAYREQMKGGDNSKALREKLQESEKLVQEGEARIRTLDVVDRMYESGPDRSDAYQLESRNFGERMTDSFVDGMFGGVGEQFDAFAEYENTKILKKLAEFEMEAAEIEAKAQEVDLYRYCEQLDKLSAREDASADAWMTLDDGGTRLVLGGKPIDSQADLIIKQAVSEIGTKPEDREKLKAKILELAKEQNVDTFKMFDKASDRSSRLENLGIDDETKKAYEAFNGKKVSKEEQARQDKLKEKQNEENKKKGKREVEDQADLLIGVDINDLLREVLHELGIDTDPSKMTLEMKAKVKKRLMEKAKELGRDLKKMYAELFGSSSIDTSIDSTAERAFDRALDKSIEINLFRKIDQKINSEIDSKINGVIARIQVDEEKKAKRPKIDFSAEQVDQKQIAEYEITEAERAAIGEQVKAQIKKGKLKGEADIRGHKDEIVKAYIESTKGKISPEEAALQVDKFMEDLSVERTLKGRTRDAAAEGLRTGKIKEAARTEEKTEKQNILTQIRDSVSHTEEASAADIAEQNRVLEGLFNQMAMTYKRNEEVAAGYGKKSDSLTDYKQYVKIKGSSNYQKAKQANKVDKKLSLEMGQDPGVYGPLVGLEKVVKNI